MNGRSIATAIAVIAATAAPAWAQQQTDTGLPKSARQEMGSQLLPEAQPPFDPKAVGEGASGSSAAPEMSDAGADGPAQAAGCDYRACAATYRSFDPGNCTYQPLAGGPRRLCER